MKLIIVLTAILAATALCLASPSAADPCPTNVTCIAQVGCQSSTAATGGQEAIFDGGVYANTTFNWITRGCGAITQLPFVSSVTLTATAEASDDFFVTGIAPGTPITIHASIRVVGRALSGGTDPSANWANGWLEEANVGRVEAIASVGYSIDEIRSLDVPNLAGQPFRLTMGAGSSSNDGNANVGVTLSFTGLPPGAAVFSCQVGPPVPAVSSTWGGLKLRYH